MLLKEKDGIAFGEIRPEQISPSGELNNNAALKLVVQDAERAEAWLGQKQWTLGWREADVLYQSPRSVSPWEGTGVLRANVSRYLVATHVNSIVPNAHKGLFYEDPPFVLRPRPGTTEQTVRQKTAVLGYGLDVCDFETEAEQGLFHAAIFGSAVFKRGWVSKTVTEKKYVRAESPASADMPLGGKITIPTEKSEQFKVEETERHVQQPTFDHIDNRYILPDPGWRKPDIRHAKWVIHVLYMTFAELNALRDEDGWDIPPEDELKALCFPPKEQPRLPGSAEMSSASFAGVHHAMPRFEKSTSDPLEQPLQVLERWDGERVVVVLQKQRVIRNERHDLGRHPFYSFNWWNVPDSGWGIGIGKIVGQDQRVAQGTINGALDMLSLALNQQYVRSRGANVPTQQIRQRLGGIIDVDGKVDDAFKLLEVPKVPPETWAVIQNAGQSAESATGANEPTVQGAMPSSGRSSITRTATGAGALASAAASRIEGQVERFVRQVFIPFLEDLDEMINERMPISALRDILGERAGEDVLADFDAEAFLNAKVRFEVLAGAHLSAKRGMQQVLPVLIQIFTNPEILSHLHEIGWTVDVKELLEMMMESGEWKNTRDVIRPMSPQEQQAMQAQNQAAQQLQSKMALNQQQGKIKSELTDQKQQGQLASNIIEQSLERATGEELRSDFRNEADGK